MAWQIDHIVITPIVTLFPYESLVLYANAHECIFDNTVSVITLW
jgi:hypothetical protein